MKQQKAKNFTTDKLSEYASVFLNKVTSLPNIVFYIAPLLILSLWLLAVILHGDIKAPQTYYLLQYVFTYDHGFVARGLFGEVLSWFVDVVTDEIVVTCNIVVNFLLVIASSLCFGKALSKAKTNPDVFPVVVFLCVFVCFLPLSFGDFFIDVKHDKTIWIITLMAVFFSGNKYSIWLVPLLCILASLVNPVFMFISMVLIAIILLHKYFSSNFSVKNLIICIITYASIIFLGIYAVTSQQELGFESAEEMVLFYFSRYEKPLDPEVVSRFGTDWIFDYFVSFAEGFKLVTSQYFYEIYYGPSSVFSFIWSGIPVFSLFAYFWVKAIRNESDKFQKLIYFLCSLVPLVSLPSSIISWEFAKYFGHNLIIEFGLVLYFINQDLPSFKETIRQIIHSMKAKPFITVLLSSYILTIIHGSAYVF